MPYYVIVPVRLGKAVVLALPVSSDYVATQLEHGGQDVFLIYDQVKKVTKISECWCAMQTAVLLAKLLRWTWNGVDSELHATFCGRAVWADRGKLCIADA